MMITPPVASKPPVVRNFSPYLLALFMACVAVGVFGAVSMAQAQTTSIPNGRNIADFAIPTLGINLQGANASLFDPAAAPSTYFGYALPGTAWTITSPSGGSTITLNDGSGHYGYFDYSGSGTYTLTVTNPLVISGGSVFGAFYIENGDLTIANGDNALTFANNNGNNGGAIAATGNVSLGANATLSGNTASSGGDGGAILALGSVTLGANATLNNNTASGDGGAIYALNGDVKFGDNAVLSNNTASGDGGAINAGGNVSLGANATLNNNNATTGSGGAIYAVNSVTIGANAILNNNTASGDNGGGAIYTDNGDVSLGANATLSNNTAGGYGQGGAIFANNGDVKIGDNAVLSNNTAGTDGNGGAIDANGNVTLGNNAVLNNNIADTANGGAIYAYLGNVTLGDNAILSNNTAGGWGGAIHADSGSVTLGDNAILSNNTAGNNNGGAIYAWSDVKIGDSATLSNNTAGSDGGAIYAGGDVKIGDSATLSNNTASGGGYGGAINAIGNVTLGNNAILSNNTADGNGGAIYAYSGDVKIGDNAILNNNNATTGPGGAIYAEGNVTLGNSATLSNNTAGSDGGAIYAGGDVKITGSLTAANNNATNGFGGVIQANGNVTVGGDATLSNNRADGYGGAISVGGAVSINGNLTADGNKAATFDGGAIDAVNDVTVKGDAILTNNTAGGQGGAIHTGSGNVTIGGNATLSSNTATGNGGAIDAEAGSVTINAPGGVTSLTYNTAGGLGGAIYLDPVALALNANGGNIIFAHNMAGGVANAVYIDNQPGDDAQVFLHTNGGNIYFFDPIANNNVNGPITVTKDGPGTVSFDGSLYGDAVNRTSQVYANTLVNAGTFEVRNNAVYGMNAPAGQPDSTFAVAAGATLAGGVAGTVIADQVSFAGGAVLNIAGGNPGFGNVFTIASKTLTFAPGSRVIFNTVLNSGVPQNTDLLVLSHGATVGTASVTINNLGGLGALTVGDGIRLVQTVNGATTTPASFVLAGGSVAAGAYQYTLQRSGVNGATPDDWFLRSTTSGGGGNQTIPFAPQLPNYRMEVPVYMAAPALAERMGRTMLGTYHDRRGEEYLFGKPGQEMAAWMRVFGEFGHTGFNNGASSFGSHGPSYDFGIDGVQLGFDALRLESDSGLRHVAGLYGGYMHGHADVNQVYSGSKAGSVDMDAYSLGAYYTLKGEPGWYVDAVLQPTWYANAEARSEQGAKIHPNGFGILGSLEGGYPIQLGNDFAIEPQTQIIYQHARLDNGSDYAGRVKYGDVDSWVGRLGVRATKNWTTQSGRKGTVWARVNVWHQLGDDAKTTFTNTNGQYPTVLKTSLGETWGQIGLGVSGQLTEKLSGFITGDYNQGLGNNNGHSFAGKVGLKYTF